MWQKTTQVNSQKGVNLTHFLNSVSPSFKTFIQVDRQTKCHVDDRELKIWKNYVPGRPLVTFYYDFIILFLLVLRLWFADLTCDSYRYMVCGWLLINLFHRECDRFLQSSFCRRWRQPGCGALCDSVHLATRFLDGQFRLHIPDRCLAEGDAVRSLPMEHCAMLAQWSLQGNGSREPQADISECHLAGEKVAGP